MFESIGNFFSNIKKMFHNGYSKVTGLVSNAYNKVTGTVSLVANTVYTDAKSVVSGTGHLIEHTIDTSKNIASEIVHSTKDVLEHGQDIIGKTISNTASSLSMPLMVALGLGGYFLLTKK